MSFVDIYGQFSKAARVHHPEQQSLIRGVDKEVFRQILQPINAIMLESPSYANTEIEVNQQLEEFRQICNEVQVGHTTDDYIVKLGRNELLNTLQIVLESVEEANSDILDIDYNDLFTLTNLTDVIRGNANIYREFMKSPSIASALDRVADNIDMAQSRLWKAGLRSNINIIH